MATGRQPSGRRAAAGRATRGLTIAALVVAVLLVALVMFDPLGAGGYKIYAEFRNAGQVSSGGLVEVSGRQIGTIRDRRLTGNNTAELELAIDDDWAPLPRGTTAIIRQFGISGPASRYVELRLPPRGSVEGGASGRGSDGRERADGEWIPDGGRLDLDQTTSIVDFDEIFRIFDRRTRRSLRGVFKGSERQYRGQGANASEGWLYLDPALVSASRLFQELNRDTPNLERFFVETSRLVGDVAERREDLSSLVSNLAETTGAIVRPRGALAEAIARLPPFMRQANTTYVNLRATLDDLEPFVEDAKPVARKAAPYTAELRRLVEDLEPAVGDLARTIRRPGRSNDLIELAKATLPLRDIAVGPVQVNGEEREGALPAAAEALASATPRFAFARPYSVDFTGWLDDFSHSGIYDAQGGFSRVGTHVSAFSFKNGTFQALAPIARVPELKDALLIGQTNRCPGASERDIGDGSNPWKPTPEFNCDPSQILPGD